ncbi:MAG: phosphate ABC transporter substrate-binding protein [Candidatus Heimdallarchaeota archaeon]|nr:phosphate ABC transporter substrate-binding protein [Candidatus Heimdallarchaeota archaeon]
MSFSRKRERLTIILLIMIPIASVAGWFLAKSTLKGGETYEINIEGSSTVYKIIERSRISFNEYHPSIRVTVSGTGTGAGIASLIDRQCHIAMASRPFKEDEQINANGSLVDFAFAKDALAIIVHSSANPINITLNIARAIFNGTIDNWSHEAVSDLELTGDIQVVVRESGSGTRDAFNELVMGDIKQLEPGSNYTSDALQKSSNQLIKDAVAANSNYIGYLGLGYIDEEVKALSIEGVAPSLESVKAGSYLIQRELYLITFGDPEGLVREFINWSFSPEGQDIVLQTGFINVAPTTDEIE